ncbi:MAG: hypothetical protein IJD38_06365 [Clostridia bacterium]|nr:hypothetical protein [Clostridia bacterium]
MFRFECKKLISNKFILGLFILLFLLNALLSYSEAKHDPATDLSEDVLAALEAYNEDPEAWKAEYDRLTAYYNEVFYPKVQQEMQEFLEKNPNERIAIRNYIASVALNKTVIIATHVVSDVEFIAREAIMLKKGVISDSGSPYELTQKIEGQVWQTVVAAEEVQAMQEKFRVVNIQNGEQGVILRILSDVKPTEDSVTVVPSLEDYYLYVFGDIL